MKTPPDHSAIYCSAPLEDPSKQIRLLRCTGRTKASNLIYEFVVCSLPLARPEDHDSDLDSSLDATLLNDESAAFGYDAISYTWGNPNKRRFIQVNNTPVDVTANCYEALSQARANGSNCTWIDSVCINQQDLTEKGAQVALMWDVYHSADRVLVCTGPQDGSSDRVYAAMLDMFRLVAPSIKKFDISSLPDTMIDISYPSHEKPDGYFWESYWKPWLLSKGSAYCTALCGDYNRLLKRPYFSRLWIAQELRAGSSHVYIMFGVSMASWRLLNHLDYALFRALEQHQGRTLFFNENNIDRSGQVTALDALISDPEKANLGYLQWTLRLRCQDARDRIFGTLHFIDWAQLGTAPLQPDYTKSAFKIAVLLGSLKETLHMNIFQLTYLVRALEITACDLLLEPLFAFNQDQVQPCPGSIGTWEVPMQYICRLGNLQRADIGDFIIDFYYDNIKTALIVRVDSKFKKVSIVSRADRHQVYRGQQQRASDARFPWDYAIVTMEATVEEMIGFLAPDSTESAQVDIDPAPLVFRAPKMVSFATQKGCYWTRSKEDYEYHEVVPQEQMTDPVDCLDEDVPDVELNAWTRETAISGAESLSV